MLSVLTNHLAVVAAAFGVLSHLTYFIHGEHLTNIPKILPAVLFSQCTTVFFLNFFGRFPALAAVRLVLYATWAYLLGLWTSMIIYRIFFHPLRSWPGPFMARITQFHRVYSVRKLDQFRYLQELHQKYGDFVRVGL
jgi:tryprostatin B 6-hydroxylase